jgi:hypothetical protein
MPLASDTDSKGSKEKDWYVAEHSHTTSKMPAPGDCNEQHWHKPEKNGWNIDTRRWHSRMPIKGVVAVPQSPPQCQNPGAN